MSIFSSMVGGGGISSFVNKAYGYLDAKLRYWYWKANGDKPIRVDDHEIRIRVSNYWGDYREIRFFEGNEVEEMRDILEELGEDDVFLDVGANIGIHSILGSNVAKETYAIEPYPVNASHLLSNKYANESEIEIYNCAFSDGEQYIRLAGPKGGFLADGSAALSHHSISSKVGPGDKSNEIHVRTETGDEFLNDNHLNAPNVVKIDVEGEEKRVIDGLENTLNSQECRVVYCEIHEDRIDSGDVIEKLEALGFSIEEIDSRDYGRTVKARK